MNSANLRWQLVSGFASAPRNQIFVSWHNVKLETSLKRPLTTKAVDDFIKLVTWPAKRLPALQYNSVYCSKRCGVLKRIEIKRSSRSEVVYKKGFRKYSKGEHLFWSLFFSCVGTQARPSAKTPWAN